MTTVEDVLARLDKDTLAKFKRGSEIEKAFLPTASLGLNMLLGGGLPKGHQTTIWGNESSGKSAAMYETIGINQKDGVVCGLIDVERTYDPDWAGRLGVNNDDIFVARTSDIATVTDTIVKWVAAGVELIVIDSISALMPRSFYEKDGELKQFEKTGQVGQQARELGQMARMIQGENWDTALVFISQVRMDLGNSFMPGMKPSGGKETGHADSLRVRIFSSKSEKQAITDKVQYGDKLMEEIVGRKVTWNIDKNKVNGKYGTGEYDFYTQGDHVGVDRASELFDYGVKYGIIEATGAWSTVYGERLQGRTKAVAHIRNNPEVAEKLEKEIVGIYQSL